MRQSQVSTLQCLNWWMEKALGVAEDIHKGVWARKGFYSLVLSLVLFIKGEWVLRMKMVAHTLNIGPSRLGSSRQHTRKALSGLWIAALLGWVDPRYLSAFGPLCLHWGAWETESTHLGSSSAHSTVGHLDQEPTKDLTPEKSEPVSELQRSKQRKLVNLQLEKPVTHPWDIKNNFFLTLWHNKHFGVDRHLLSRQGTDHWRFEGFSVC